MAEEHTAHHHEHHSHAPAEHHHGAGHSKYHLLGFSFDKGLVIKALLVLIVGYTFVSSVAMVEGPSFFGDDNTYVGLAAQILHGQYSESGYIFSVRPLQFFPIAFFYLFGINILTSSLWDIISFTLTVLIAYLIGRELYNEYAGLLSAFLLSMFPLTAILGVTVSDDIPMMFINAITMLCIVYAMKGKSKWWWTGAGAALVASPLTTPEGFILMPVVALFLIVEIARKSIKLDKRFVYFPIGIAAALALLGLFNYVYSGNPLITFTVNSHYFSAIGGANDTTTAAVQDLWYYPETIFSYNVLSSLASGNINTIIGNMNLYNYDKTGFYFYLLVLAIAYLVIRWERRAYFALFWFGAGILYLEFGPMHIGLSPFSYLLSHRLDRFLTLVAVPLCLCIAFALIRAMESKDTLRKYFAIGTSAFVVILLASTGIIITLFWHNTVELQIYDQVQIGNYLSQLPSYTKIYMTGTFSNVLMYMGFNNMSRVNAYDSIQNCSKIPAGSYIIIPKYFSVFNLDYTPNPSAYCPQWQLVLYPQYPGPVNQQSVGAAQYSEGKLYYNPGQ